MQHHYSFSKSERLAGEKKIQQLFEDGKSFITYPLRVLFLQNSTQAEPCKVLFSVPKRRFKRANKRNLLKRRMREAYRLNKQLLYDDMDEQKQGQMIGITYIANDVLPFSLIEKKMTEAMHMLQHHWEKKCN